MKKSTCCRLTFSKLKAMHDASIQTIRNVCMPTVQTVRYVFRATSSNGRFIFSKTPVQTKNILSGNIILSTELVSSPTMCTHAIRCVSTKVRSTGQATSKTTRDASVQPIIPPKTKGSRNESKIFVDYKRVEVIAGNGGNGAVSFASIPRKEFAGPDGGDGGNGAHVIFTATKKLNSLNHLDTTLKANNGINGNKDNCHGASVDHKYVQVPLGTIICTTTGKILANLEKESDYYIAARGGAGGKGNKFFLSNENRAPVEAEVGGKGEHRILSVELQTMANVGLIGFPNAGKSTLLRAITKAKPKVAAYPFTTLNPHVGVVEYTDHEQITVADIPGLIRGAHKNRGLGFAFLRHIERCTCLLYVIDLSFTEPWTQLSALKLELEQYSKGLSERPHAVIGNKMDLKIAERNLQILRDHIDMPVYPVSAIDRTGIKELMIHIRQLYEDHKMEKHKICEHRPDMTQNSPQDHL